jgi:hypothetical protein
MNGKPVVDFVEVLDALEAKLKELHAHTTDPKMYLSFEDDYVKVRIQIEFRRRGIDEDNKA